MVPSTIRWIVTRYAVISGIIDEVCPRCGRRDGEGVSLEKLHKLGLYRNLNADTIGYHGDRFEEADRRPNPLGCCNG